MAPELWRAQLRRHFSFVVNFRAAIKPHKEMIPGQRKVSLTFEKDSTGQWKVIDYSHSSPRQKVRL